MIKFQKTVLPNGLRVILAPMQETQAVTVLFLFGVGSRYETAEQNGLSHFLEHMYFKGTKQRPTTLDISQELDALGADYNAYTGEEKTGYYVSTAAESFPIAFEVLTDMLYNSVFAEDEIEREKGVIREEIKMYQDNPMSYLNEVAKELVFGDTPLGRDIAGKPKTVDSFKRSDFLDYKKSFYGPANTVLAIAGNPKNHDWLSIVSSALSHLPKQPTPTYKRQLPVEGQPVAIGHKAIDQVHLELSHYGVPIDDPKIDQFSVLSNILGGTMSSRLFVEVRERRGLAYYVRSTHQYFQDIGVFSCNAGVDRKKLPEALKVIIEQIEILKTEPVTELELKRAKQNIKGKLSLMLEDSHSIARYLAYDELEMREIMQPEEYIRRIEKVTADDIMNLAKTHLTAATRKLALVGPIEQKEKTALTKLLKG